MNDSARLAHADLHLEVTVAAQAVQRSGFPDARIRLLPETGRQIPFEDDRWFFLGEFAGDAEAVCPRAVLRRVLARADELGYVVRAAFEYEFFVFDETPHSLRDKHFRDLRPVAVPLSPAATIAKVEGIARRHGWRVIRS